MSHESNVDYVHYVIFIFIVLCPTIIIKDGRVRYTSLNKFGDIVPGAAAHIECYAYHDLTPNGARLLVCQDDGSWNHKTPGCLSNSYLLCMPLLLQW